MAIRNRCWTIPERIVLSLWAAIALLPLYFIVVLAVTGGLGSRPGERITEYLAFPLVWPAVIIEHFYHPRIEAVGDVLGAAFDVFMATIAIDYLVFGLSVFVSLSILDWIKKFQARRREADPALNTLFHS